MFVIAFLECRVGIFVLLVDPFVSGVFVLDLLEKSGSIPWGLCPVVLFFGRGSSVGLGGFFVGCVGVEACLFITWVRHAGSCLGFCTPGIGLVALACSHGVSLVLGPGW